VARTTPWWTGGVANPTLPPWRRSCGAAGSAASSPGHWRTTGRWMPPAPRLDWFTRRMHALVPEIRVHAGAGQRRRRRPPRPVRTGDSRALWPLPRRSADAEWSVAAEPIKPLPPAYGANRPTHRASAETVAAAIRGAQLALSGHGDADCAASPSTLNSPPPSNWRDCATRWQHSRPGMTGDGGPPYREHRARRSNAGLRTTVCAMTSFGPRRPCGHAKTIPSVKGPERRAHAITQCPQLVTTRSLNLSSRFRWL
jgi:hypothetical protein